MLVDIKWIPLITKKKMWNCIFDMFISFRIPGGEDFNNLAFPYFDYERT